MSSGSFSDSGGFARSKGSARTSRKRARGHRAKRGWAQIRRAHANLLGKLEPDVSKVVLGGKGTYYRLKAGPLASNGEAKALCGKLKRRRQFCEPTITGG